MGRRVEEKLNVALTRSATLCLYASLAYQLRRTQAAYFLLGECAILLVHGRALFSFEPLNFKKIHYS